MITSGSGAGLQKLRQLTELHRKQAAGQSTLHASSHPFHFILQAVVPGEEYGKGSKPGEEPMLDLFVGPRQTGLFIPPLQCPLFVPVSLGEVPVRYECVCNLCTHTQALNCICLYQCLLGWAFCDLSGQQAKIGGAVWVSAPLLSLSGR